MGEGPPMSSSLTRSLAYDRPALHPLCEGNPGDRYRVCGLQTTDQVTAVAHTRPYGATDPDRRIAGW